MDRNVRELWCSALRSGRYQQGRNFLQKAGRYCALGVLCEVAVSVGVIEPSDPDPLWPTGHVYGANREHSALPDEVVDWSGMTTVSDIADMNDFGGMSFAEIADYIENEL